MSRVFARAMLSLALAAFVAPSGVAQSAERAPVNVYLDCQDGGCDFDYLRQEIKSVSWVRDRTASDVHILLTRQSTGAGGTQFSAAFLGVGRFAGMGDTLTFSLSPTAVEDEQRKGIAQLLRVGLVRFVARASGYDAMTISFGGAKNNGERPPQHDRWNFWVFETSVDGFGDGDAKNKFHGLEGQLEARRITERWKTELQVEGNYNESKFKLEDGTTFANIQRNYDFQFEHVKSVGRHIALGLTGGVGTSTFSNQKRVLKVAPAIEYDVFPYSEATRRAVRFQYGVGVTHYTYEDTTIFLKLREGVLAQQFRADVSAKQPWGTVNVGTLFRNQVFDATKWRASIGGHVSVRVFRGLNVNFGGDVSSIHDQINLRLKDLSDEDVLVRARERGTSYRYFMNFGISYTFGSLFNNVVNPRFDLGDFF
jgi:hypothetical protein